MQFDEINNLVTKFLKEKRKKKYIKQLDNFSFKGKKSYNMMHYQW